MRSVTGVNVKVCEAIYNGLPVLASTAGLGGLDLAADPAVIACETIDAWLSHLQPQRLHELRGRTPSESLRKSFDVAEHVPGAREFVDRIAASSPCPAASSA
jgi:hypothetical protein